MARIQTANGRSDLRLRFKAISPLVDRVMRLVEGSHCDTGKELQLEGLRPETANSVHTLAGAGSAVTKAA